MSSFLKLSHSCLNVVSKLPQRCLKVVLKLFPNCPNVVKVGSGLVATERRVERVSRFERRGDGLAHCLGRRDICTKSVALSTTSNMTLQLLFPRKQGAEGVELGKYIGVWKLGQCLRKCKFCFRIFRISECFFRTSAVNPFQSFSHKV